MFDLRPFVLTILIGSLPETSLAAPLPKPQWVMFYAENSCILIRPRSGTASGLRIESRPYEAEHELQFLLVRDGRGTFVAPGTLSVPSLRASTLNYMTVEELRYTSDRRVKTAIAKGQLALAAKEGSLGVTIPGKLDERVSTPGLAKAMLAMKKCEDGLAVKWGAPRNWTVDPTPNVDPMTIFRSADYPTSLLNANVQGNASMLVKIGASGAPLECRSISRTDQKQFVTVACAVIRKRLTFTPAKDATGRAVESYYVSPRVKFRLMN